MGNAQGNEGKASKTGKSPGKVKGLMKSRARKGKNQVQFTEIKPKEPNKIIDIDLNKTAFNEKCHDQIEKLNENDKPANSRPSDSWYSAEEPQENSEDNNEEFITPCGTEISLEPQTTKYLECEVSLVKPLENVEPNADGVWNPRISPNKFTHNLTLNSFKLNEYSSRRQSEERKRKFSKLGISKTSQISLDGNEQDCDNVDCMKVIKNDDVKGDCRIVSYLVKKMSETNLSLEGDSESNKHKFAPESAGVKLGTMSKSDWDSSIKRPKFVPEKLNFQLYEKFEGYMLINWCVSEISDVNLKNALLETEIKLLAAQFCTNLLAVGVLKQIQDKDVPMNNIFKPDCMYYWTYAEITPYSVPPTPGRISIISWPPATPDDSETMTNEAIMSSEPRTPNEHLERLESSESTPLKKIDFRSSARDVELLSMEEEIKRLNQEIEKYKTLVEIQNLTAKAVNDFDSPMDEVKSLITDCDKDKLTYILPTRVQTDTLILSNKLCIDISIQTGRGMGDANYMENTRFTQTENNFCDASTSPISCKKDQYSSTAPVTCTADSIKQEAPKLANLPVHDLVPPPPPMPSNFMTLSPQETTSLNEINLAKQALVDTTSLVKPINQCLGPPPPPLPISIPGIPPPPPPPMPPSQQVTKEQLPSPTKSENVIPPPPSLPNFNASVPLFKCPMPPPPPLPCIGAPPPPPPLLPTNKKTDGPLPLPFSPAGGYSLQKAALKKTPLNPTAPMKPLYWTRIITPPTTTEPAKSDTLWNEIDEITTADFGEFCDLFSRQVITKKPSQKKVSKSSKVEVVKLLDSKRSQNVGILAQSLHVEFHEIENAIYNFDTSEISLEAIQQIYEARATPEELELIKNHITTKPDIPLDKPENFLYELSEISNFAERVSCLMFMIEFEDAISTINHTLTNLKSTCTFMTTNTNLKNVMAIILTLGNYMNGGNITRGQADGFGLEILGKLKDVKSKDSKITLLHYVVKMYLKSLETIVDITTAVLPVPDSECIRIASSVDFDNFALNLLNLKKQLNDCETKTKIVIETSPPETTQPFIDKMTTFLEHSRAQIAHEEENLNDCKTSFIETMKFYLYKPKSGSIESVYPSTFFELWFNFCREFTDIFKREIIKAESERIKDLRKQEKEKQIKTKIKMETKTTKDKKNGLKARALRYQAKRDSFC